MSKFNKSLNFKSQMEIGKRNARSRETRQHDLANAAAGVVVSTCRIKVNNAGEARAPFIFACKYSQIPTITFGYEMHSDPIAGRVPVFSASVIDFATYDKSSSRLYIGANLLIVSESTSDISFVVIATATGVAFSGPLE